MMVKTSSAMVADDSSSPGMSGAAASGSFDAGTVSAARITATAATGAMAMKMLAQLKCSSSHPPAIGPIAMATPEIAPHRPMARARSLRSVKTLESSESVAGKVMAAPSSHHGPGRDELRRVGREATSQAGGPEHGQPGQQHALAAEPVGQAAEGEQQRGEDEVVGVDDPLQRSGGGMQLAHQGGKRHVHQGGVQVDEECCEQQRGEDHGFGSHSRDVLLVSLKNQLLNLEDQLDAGYAHVVRSYGQYCSIAKAMDIVGDRWTLLIIRELLIRGACRYTDLKNGLPGIATNLLSDRIRELESAGLIRREDAPPPVATALFHLTKAGAELQPVLDAIGRWGVRYMIQPADGDQFRGHWFSFPASFFLHDRDPGGPPVSIELRTASNPVVIEVSGGSATTRLGTAPAPDLVLRGEPQLILALFSGHLTAAEVTDRGLEISGDASVLERVLPQPVGA